MGKRIIIFLSLSVLAYSQQELMFKINESNRKKIEITIDAPPGAKRDEAFLVEQEIGYYRVKKGDTLFKLAKRFNTTVDELMRLNGLKSANSLDEHYFLKYYVINDQKLVLKKEIDKRKKLRYYIVKRGDTMRKIAEKLNTPVETLAELNAIKDYNKVNQGKILKYYR